MYIRMLFFALLFSVAVYERPAEAACETDKDISIARMSWPSAEVLALITAKVLEDGMGCKVHFINADTVPASATMLNKGTPIILPELYLSSIPDVWKKILKQDQYYKASDSFVGGVIEGFWIPDYVQKDNPGLRSLEDLPKYASLFVEKSSGGKARLYGCPPGWACEIIVGNYFRALKLEEAGYELFSPGSDAALRASVERAVTRKKPVLSYYWTPTLLIGQNNLVQLGTPATYDKAKFDCLSDKNCENPQVTAWPPSEAAVVVRTDLAKEAPAIAHFLSRLSIPSENMTAVLTWLDESRATSEEGTVHFFKTYPDLWKSWLDKESIEALQKTI